MTDSKTATERLREGLTARGVEWESKDIEGVKGFHHTRWQAMGVQWCYVEFVGNNYARLKPAREFQCTPEQAIAVTLGSGRLTAKQVEDVVEKHWHDLPDEYDMPEATALPEYSYDWYAIANELNATLGSGECEMTEAEIEDRCGEHYVYLTGWTCSECGHGSTSLYSDEIPKFCPNCGAKVKAVKR